MGWALWLAAPIGATTLAALWAWFRGWRARRAARPPSTEQSVLDHGAYLDALVIPASSAVRPERQSAEDPS